MRSRSSGCVSSSIHTVLTPSIVRGLLAAAWRAACALSDPLPPCMAAAFAANSGSAISIISFVFIRHVWWKGGGLPLLLRGGRDLLDRDHEHIELFRLYEHVRGNATAVHVAGIVLHA